MSEFGISPEEVVYGRASKKQPNGVWALVSYHYFVYISSVYPTKEAAMAAKTGSDSVVFLPFGEGNTYFGMADAKENLETP